MWILLTRGTDTDLRYIFVFFSFFLFSNFSFCYILPEVFHVLTLKHLCIVIGEPCAKGLLCKTWSSVCGSGCTGRENGDCGTRRWVLAVYCKCVQLVAGPHALVHLPFRPLLLCRSAVPSRVHLKANQTISSILRPPASCCRKTPELPLKRLPAVTSVSSTTVLHQ